MQLSDATRDAVPQPYRIRGPGAADAQLRPRRGPRAEEITLMRSLVAGPRAITSGPIGRCVKRDWCRAVVVEEGEGAGRRSTVVFALTDMGRALIA
ncbi:hypothetical protein [Lichenibacterium ramalinae]|uniref:Uncharacterized protein n=1 Tax=Lichenibacterium ramalinae TaxID=2316527 RepID=A0A4Q2R9D8_9HYPH|nr:hypothetical protein [Lichenibacterium ramalinae]RYB02717.1 hypothetical protein D3272_20205 [Lichenibacterium ramalinae]